MCQIECMASFNTISRNYEEPDDEPGIANLGPVDISAL